MLNAKEGKETKPAQIEALLSAFPQRRFVLIGDSGEQDAQVYAAIMRRYPERILQAYIRNVTGVSRQDPQLADAFRGLPAERWALFTDAKTLRLPAL